ncbi:MAG: hypothetical protein ABIH23_07410 [bacterium]
MGTPKRTSILLDLRTTLALVTAPTYKTTVATVDDGVRPLLDVPESERPYIGWDVGIETPAHDAFDSILWKIPIALAGYVWTTDDWETRSTAINDFVDDLIAVVAVDPSRDGYAISTWVRGMMTNENEIDAGNDGWCIIDMEIEYERTVTSS